MSLRRSPVLTPAALWARRLNSLLSTGPRTDRGKAWSRLNALRHGRRARNLRQKIERTGDFEALYLFDWFHANLIKRWDPISDRAWRHRLRVAARVWCFMTGRGLRPRLKANGLRTGAGGPVYRYGPDLVCPVELRISDKFGRSIRFRNPTPSRRKRVKEAWIPAVEFFDPPPRLPRAKRVRNRRDGEQGPAIPADSPADFQSPLATSSDGASTTEAGLATGHPPPATSFDGPAFSDRAPNPAERKKRHSQTELESSLESASYPKLGNRAAEALPESPGHDSAADQQDGAGG